MTNAIEHDIIPPKYARDLPGLVVTGRIEAPTDESTPSSASSSFATPPTPRIIIERISPERPDHRVVLEDGCLHTDIENAIRDQFSQKEDSADPEDDPQTKNVMLESFSSIDTAATTATTESLDSPEDLMTASLPSPLTPESRTRSVRFRSRVRITSGLNGHRQRHSPSEPSAPSPLPSHLYTRDRPRRLSNTSTISTRSSSPSSSISAPLRSREDEWKPGWGPLGMRVSLFARARGPPKRRVVERKNLNRQRNPDENTPLLGPGPGQAVFEDDDDEYIQRMNESHEARLNRELDVVFGKWPGRLLNRHWWWWQLEPIVCCTLCIDDSDWDDY